ncbi:MAG TPA: hypothetical protein VGW32_01750 [Pyrinomonadaceae bacterium]|nr:hypothetical protein [Pyrinomonadaceae bacterium]
MKTLFALTIFFGATSLVYGQSAPTQPSQCSLKLAQSPSVRGIKLGMSVENLLAFFPGSASEDGIKLSASQAANFPHFGVVGFGVFPSRYSTKERFAGIDTLNFVILDGRLAQFEVQYLRPPNGANWRNIDDFIAKITDAFQVPASKNWTAHQSNPSTKELKCDGFQLRASNVNLTGSLTVATVDAPFQIRKERSAAFEERARRDFRP